MKWTDLKVGMVLYMPPGTIAADPRFPPGTTWREHYRVIFDINPASATIFTYWCDDKSWASYSEDMTPTVNGETPEHVGHHIATPEEIARIPLPWPTKIKHLEPRRYPQGFKIELKHRAAIEANKNAVKCTVCGQPTREVWLFQFSTRLCPVRE